MYVSSKYRSSSCLSGKCYILCIVLTPVSRTASCFLIFATSRCSRCIDVALHDIIALINLKKLPQTIVKEI